MFYLGPSLLGPRLYLTIVNNCKQSITSLSLLVGTTVHIVIIHILILITHVHDVSTANTIRYFKNRISMVQVLPSLDF